VRKIVLLFLLVASALATATPAAAAIFVRLTTTSAHHGGVLRAVGNAAHMPLYALPAARMPCARYGTCSPTPIHRDAAPRRKAFVLLGYTPGATGGFTPTQPFSIRLPETLRLGRYKVFVWCAMCGGSLIIAGNDSSGQTLRVLR